MPPRLDPDSPDSDLIAVRLSKELTAALDAEVKRQRAAHPDLSIGRSNVLRGLVRTHLPPAAVEAPSGRPVEAPAAREVVRRPRPPEALSVVAQVRAHVVALRTTLSAREIATRAGVSDDTINKLLRGKGLKADSIKKLLSVPVEGGAQ